MNGLRQFGVISDPHANPAALRAVLADARGRGIHDFVCLGDLVGYNIRPRQVVELLRERGIPCVAGNHDLMLLDRVDPATCNPLGRRVIELTQPVLPPGDRAFLASLPDTLAPEPSVLATHSVPGDTVIRLRHPEQFREQGKRIRRDHPQVRICLTGHTHFQEVWSVTESGAVSRRRGPVVPLEPRSFHFVNPGSVGWPRDGDPRAGYAVLDLTRSRACFFRIAYDLREINRENTEAGLEAVPGSRDRGWIRAAAAARGIAARVGLVPG